MLVKHVRGEGTRMVGASDVQAVPTDSPRRDGQPDPLGIKGPELQPRECNLSEALLPPPKVRGAVYGVVQCAMGSS